MILNLDLDGTVFDYEKALAFVVASEKGMAIHDIPPALDWSFSNWPIDNREEFMKFHTLLITEGWMGALKPYENASEVLWRLSDKGVYIRVTTHRLIIKDMHGEIARQTVESLDKNNIPYRDLVFLKDKVAIGGDLLIDDGPHNIEAYRKANRPVLTYHQIYNAHLAGPRAIDWLGVEKYVEKML